MFPIYDMGLAYMYVLINFHINNGLKFVKM